MAATDETRHARPSISAQTEQTRRFIVIGAAAAAITFLAAAIALQIYAHRQMAGAAHDAIIIGELQAEIMRTDESITMAARMAVETDEDSWRQRYEMEAAALDVHLLRLAEALPDQPDIGANIDDVNRALIALERAAMAAAREEPARGRRLLNSDKYARLKVGYIDGARAIIQANQNAVERRHGLGLAAIALSTLLTMASIAALCGSFVYLLNRNRRQVEEKDYLHAQLEAQNADLDRRVAERTAELMAANRHFELAQKVRSVGVWEYNVAANRLDWDAICRELHGAPGEDSEGSINIWAKTLHPEDGAPARARFLKALDTNATEYNDTYRVLLADNGVRWLRGDAVIMRDESGRALRVIGVNIDVTPLMRAEQKLKDAKIAAESANAAKSTFIATMSHELRTPINGILGAAQILAVHEPAPAQLEWIEMIRNCGAELQRLISGILDLSHIEADELEIVEKRFSCEEILKEVLAVFSAAQHKKSLDIVTDIAADLPPLLVGDPDRLKQILTNLIGNAIKFTDNGAITISARMADDTLAIEIADTGVGIAPEKLPLIFERFYQVDSGLSRRFEGAGLGLSIVKEMTTLMGGSIEVESALGEGSTFRLLLPARPADPDAADIAVAAAAAPVQTLSGGVKILFAENDPDNQTVMKALLEHEGFEVVVAANAAKTLAALASRAFDVLLLDIQMPNLDARAVLKRLKADPRIAGGLKIIVVAANALKGAEREILDLGADVYLTKPVDILRLVEEIRRLTNRPPAQPGSFPPQQAAPEARRA